jgi:hypothetical protein
MTGTVAHWNSRARLLIRLDGAFEAVLGVLLAVSPVTGFYGALDLPNPATKPIVVVFGLLLVPLLPVLWLISMNPERRQVCALAVANGVGALVFAGWILAWNGAFTPPGAVFVLCVAVFLAILGGLQACTVVST